MAVVFISPRQRQKMFITGITLAVGLFCIIIATIVFFSKPKAVSSELVFNKPKISVNFEVFNSDQFKGLVPFEEMQIQFSYKATKDNEKKDGYISATSIEDARKMLEELGYEIEQIEESEIGRPNPFESYAVTTADQLKALLEGSRGETVQQGTTPMVEQQ